MLSNFKKRVISSLAYGSPPLQEQQPFLSSLGSQANISNTDNFERMHDAIIQEHRDITVAECVYVSGCTCAFCAMRSETNDIAEPICTAARPCLGSHTQRSLPSFSSVMEVLYPASCLGTPYTSPDPPSYSRNDSLAQGDDSEICPLISSAEISTPLTCNCPDPLAQGPGLTGVPSPGTSSRRALLAEPSPPPIGFDGNVLEEPLPAYSRFDRRQPCSSAASDILGPYPPLSILYRSSH